MSAATGITETTTARHATPGTPRELAAGLGRSAIAAGGISVGCSRTTNPTIGPH